MRLVRKISDGEEKQLYVAGIKIPYHVECDGEKRIFRAGILRFAYYRDGGNNSIFLRLFGKRYYIRKTRRMRHYEVRDKLTTERCQAILTKELTPLLGYRPNLKDPKTFNEKINWYKLHYHNPLVTECCDKYAVKDYAARTIGAQYVLPVLGAWEDPRDIDFDALPDRFVLKVNWSSGFNIIVKDKSTFDRDSVMRKLEYWLLPSSNSYYDTFNWGYKNMKPIIYAEEYIEQIDGQVYDYKFFMCDGKFEYMFIATDRTSGAGLTYSFFDNNFEFLPFTYGNKKNATPLPAKPKNYDKMIELAKELAKPFPFVRVDFYEVGDRVLLGEMTFYSGGGTLPFAPLKWDEELGKKIRLVVREN